MISVVIPVLDGAEFLAEVLDAVVNQKLDEPLEVLVIDSGSTDGSLAIAASFPQVRLIEIPQKEFGHGRTRNLGVSETSGDLIAFLTQDSTPATDGWLAAYREAFSINNRIGAAYGPHLPRDGVNPIMARLLIDHFAGFVPPGTPAGAPVVQRPGDTAYMSNSNSCIARAAWEQTPFRDIAYAEDQAFGRDSMLNGWSKVYVPAAGALHSHDFNMVETYRRYFDEYRGLNDSVGQKTEASATKALGVIRNSVAGDVRFVRDSGQPLPRQAAWAVRSVLHHTGRIGFGGLGARADRIPPRVRAALSFENRSDGIAQRVPASGRRGGFTDIGTVERKGVVPLTGGGGSPEGKLHIAWVIPPFSIGGGGHTTIFRMVRALEQSGHRCSIWVHDPHQIELQSESAMQKRIADHFMQLEASVHHGFRHWRGADVTVATGWDTVYKVLRLAGCRSRAYFVQDHEPEFYASSSESLFAERSYGYGLHCICASPWLAELMRRRYDAPATPFLLGVDPEEYAPLKNPRRQDTVVFYARHFTPRRAVELGVLALDEVYRRRPGTRIVLYGAPMPLTTPFPYEHLGVVTHERLRRLYGEATVGLSLSLTNYSLIPQEMMACGLPVLELAGRACEGVFGDDGSVVTLAQDDSADIADKLCELLEDRSRRDQLTAAGLEFCASHTWDAAAATVESALIETFEQSRWVTDDWHAGALA